MAFQYVIPTPPFATKDQFRWLWKFTVITRAAGKCQHCGKVRPLDGAHIQSRRARPDLQFDPGNGIGLCRSCHMKHDHKAGHRPSGRPIGMRLTTEQRRRIGESNRITKSGPEYRIPARARTLKQWDTRGRKHPPRPCACCGETFKPTMGGRFCSAACHYKFRTGKPRSGY